MAGCGGSRPAVDSLLPCLRLVRPFASASLSFPSCKRERPISAVSAQGVRVRGGSGTGDPGVMILSSEETRSREGGSKPFQGAADQPSLGSSLFRWLRDSSTHFSLPLLTGSLWLKYIQAQTCASGGIPGGRKSHCVELWRSLVKQMLRVKMVTG